MKMLGVIFWVFYLLSIFGKIQTECKKLTLIERIQVWIIVSFIITITLGLPLLDILYLIGVW